MFQPNKFLDPKQVLFQAKVSPGQTVVDLGAGNGFYALESAKLVGDKGLVYVVDILEAALNYVASTGRMQKLRNIKTIRADLDQTTACQEIPTGTADFVIAANVVHQLKKPMSLVEQAFRVLKTGGKLLVVEWNKQPSPFGPDFNPRVDVDEAKALAAANSFQPAGQVETDRYHYGLVFIK